MLARTFFALFASSLAAAGGCCCVQGNCGPQGVQCCCLCLPKPIVWDGTCNECAHGCESCADCCGDCGILSCLWRKKTCGMGCGEIYIGEWISDPPDCCDPCDQCSGCWTGPQGACCLGPCQRLLAALHGYKYCPKPSCGPACGGFCHRGSCGPACGCDGGPHGAILSGGVPYDAAISEDVLPPPTYIPGTLHESHHSIMDENWNVPRTTPVPGKPIHKAQQQPRMQMGGGRQPQMSYVMPRVASQNQRPIGSGVQQANYAR